MKLSIAQIERIEETLVLNDLVFDDIKIEMTDHIASEIENLIDTRALSYDEAFKTTFENWAEELRPLYGQFWVSPKMIVPRVVMNRIVGHIRRQFFATVVLSGILAMLLMMILDFFDFSKPVLSAAKSILLASYVATGVLLCAGRILIWRSKNTTTFSYLFKRQFLLSLCMMMIPVNSGFSHLDHIKEMKISEITFVFMNISILVYFLFSLALPIRHSETESKFQLS